eukprot:UN19765
MKLALAVALPLTAAHSNLIKPKPRHAIDSVSTVSAIDSVPVVMAPLITTRRRPSTLRADPERGSMDSYAYNDEHCTTGPKRQTGYQLKLHMAMVC